MFYSYIFSLLTKNDHVAGFLLNTVIKVYFIDFVLHTVTQCFLYIRSVVVGHSWIKVVLYNKRL